MPEQRLPSSPVCIQLSRKELLGRNPTLLPQFFFIVIGVRLHSPILSSSSKFCFPSSVSFWPRNITGCLSATAGCALCSIYPSLKQVILSKSNIISVKSPCPSSPQIKWKYYASWNPLLFQTCVHHCSVCQTFDLYHGFVSRCCWASYFFLKHKGSHRHG